MKNFIKLNYKKKNEGFVIFVALVVTGTLLLVSFGIISVSVKEAFLTSASRDSQYAFYAADTGAECAIYWDVKNSTGFSAFSTTTGTVINCNKDSTNPLNQWTVGSNSTSQFTMTFLPEPYCSIVTVTKLSDGRTTINSKGYNTCDTTNPRRAERAISVSY